MPRHERKPCYGWGRGHGRRGRPPWWAADGAPPAPGGGSNPRPGSVAGLRGSCAWQIGGGASASLLERPFGSSKAGCRGPAHLTASNRPSPGCTKTPERCSDWIGTGVRIGPEPVFGNPRNPQGATNRLCGSAGLDLVAPVAVALALSTFLVLGIGVRIRHKHPSHRPMRRGVSRVQPEVYDWYPNPWGCR
jgi:hypothetical protein